MKIRLKEILEEKEISQRELSLRTGYTEAAISRYVSGARRGSIATWIIIADALGVKLDELIVSDDYCNICMRVRDESCARCKHGKTKR